MIKRNDNTSFEFSCASCGAFDSVPFEPRPGSTLLCRTCFKKDNPSPERRGERRGGGRRDYERRGARGEGRRDDRRGPGRRGEDRRGGDSRRGGRQGGRDRGESAPRQTWAFKCVACGADDQVPFEPRPNSELYCGECHTRRKDKEQRRERYRGRQSGERHGGRHIPRIDHGTRVHCPIDCEQCGKHEVLTYVPRTDGPVLCTECREKKFGQSWYQVKMASERDSPIPPVRQRRRRVVEIHQPDHGRLKSFEKLKGNVKVRKGGSADSSDDE